jgi:hypothetical protein
MMKCIVTIIPVERVAQLGAKSAASNRRVLPVRVTWDNCSRSDGIRLKRARVNGAGGVA